MLPRLSSNERVASPMAAASGTVYPWFMLFVFCSLGQTELKCQYPPLGTKIHKLINEVPALDDREFKIVFQAVTCSLAYFISRP